MATLQIINTVISILGGGFALLVILVKPFRKWIMSVLGDRETQRCLLRDRITTTYYANRDNRTIEQYEYENIEKFYHQYKKLGGNSFVDKIWEEMQEWTVVR